MRKAGERYAVMMGGVAGEEEEGSPAMALWLAGYNRTTTRLEQGRDSVAGCHMGAGAQARGTPMRDHHPARADPDLC